MARAVPGPTGPASLGHAGVTTAVPYDGVAIVAILPECVARRVGPSVDIPVPADDRSATGAGIATNPTGLHRACGAAPVVGKGVSIVTFFELKSVRRVVPAVHEPVAARRAAAESARSVADPTGIQGARRAATILVHEIAVVALLAAI
jgi:hypothetical protein